MDRYLTTRNLMVGLALFLVTFCIGANLVGPRPKCDGARHARSETTAVLRTADGRSYTLRWEAPETKAVTVGGEAAKASGPPCPTKSGTSWCVRMETHHAGRTVVQYDAAEMTWPATPHMVPLELEHGGEATVRFLTDDRVTRINIGNHRIVSLVNDVTAIEDNEIVLRSIREYPRTDRTLDPVTMVQVEMKSGRRFVFSLIPTASHLMTESETNCVVSYIQDLPAPADEARPKSEPRTPCLSKHFSDSCLP